MNASRSWLTFLSLILSLWATAQPDSTAWFQADTLLVQAWVLDEDNQTDSALLLAAQTVPVFEQFQDWENVLNALMLQAKIHNDEKNYGPYFRLAEKITRLSGKHFSLQDDIYVLALQFSAKAAALKGDYPQAISLYQSAENSISDSLAFMRTSLRSNIGRYYRQMGDYAEALRYYQLNFATLQLPTDSLTAAQQRSKAILQMNMGRAYRELKQYPEAISQYQASATFFKTLPPQRAFRFLINAYHGMAQSYLLAGKQDSARYWAESVQQYQIGSRTFQPEINAEIKGSSALAAGDFVTAQTHLEEALALTIAQGKPAEHPVRLSIKLSNLFLQLQQYEEALNGIQQAFAYVSTGNYSLEQANPQLEAFIYKIDAIPLLVQKAQVLQAKAGRDCADRASLDLSLATYQLLTALVRTTRQGFQAQQSKLILADQTYESFEAALALSLQLYDCTQETLYLEKAFRFSELSKAALLQETLQDAQAQSRQQIPSEILQEESLLQQEIAFYKQQLFLNPPPADSQQVEPQASWREQIYQLENRYREVVAELEAEYPAYYEEKYTWEPVSLSQLQRSLAQDQQVMAYFWGTEYLYCFRVDRSQTTYWKVPINQELHLHLKTVQALISRPPESETLSQPIIVSLNTLFQQLLRGKETELAAQVTIIPDGPLSYLPFEVLVREKPQGEGPFAFFQLPYLLKERTISYQYSASLLTQHPQIRSARASYLGVAPSYPPQTSSQPNTRAGIRDQFAPLAFTEGEVSTANILWKGQTFLKEQALKNTFMKEAGKYRLLHLAMHAITFDENPAYSSLVFHASSDSVAQQLLTANEIASLQLSAELAVLSACNTGTGQQSRGEGVMSLARSFREAGCPNIVMSLWQADDQAASQVMTTYFQLLHEGQGKAIALRAAKLSQMNSNPRQAHPYYWAAFVLVGDSEPLSTGRGWIWGVGLLIALLLGGTLWYFRRRASANRSVS